MLKEDVMVADFEAYLKIHPNLYKPHRHSFYHFVLFTAGSGTHTIDFRQFDVKPGHVYFMIPGQVHSWSFKGEVNGYIVNFSEQLFNSFLNDKQYLQQFHFFKGVAADSTAILAGKTLQTIENCCKQMLLEIAGGKQLYTDAIRAQLMTLFIAVQRETGQAQNTASLPQSQIILNNFRKLVDAHYTEMKLPKDYAAILYITPNHLNALCNDLLGMSAGEVIRDRVLLEAKRLLVNAEDNISGIAWQLGFTDNSHFTKFFKKYASLTPEAFRKSIIKTM